MAGAPSFNGTFVMPTNIAGYSNSQRSASHLQPSAVLAVGSSEQYHPRQSNSQHDNQSQQHSQQYAHQNITNEATEPKKYVCTYPSCSKSYAMNRCLQQHLANTHLPIDMDRPLETLPMPLCVDAWNPEGRYVCLVCGHLANKTSGLDSHIRYKHGKEEVLLTIRRHRGFPELAEERDDRLFRQRVVPHPQPPSLAPQAPSPMSKPMLPTSIQEQQHARWLFMQGQRRGQPPDSSAYTQKQPMQQPYPSIQGQAHINSPLVSSPQQHAQHHPSSTQRQTFLPVMPSGMYTQGQHMQRPYPSFQRQTQTISPPVSVPQERAQQRHSQIQGHLQVMPPHAYGPSQPSSFAQQRPVYYKPMQYPPAVRQFYPATAQMHPPWAALVDDSHHYGQGRGDSMVGAPPMGLSGDFVMPSKGREAERETGKNVVVID
ncbi:hypothetical protein EJ08DRAFT_223056 [Tothia fuscella]|uniref:C2H2-type domain-containing protein n=1 Tax=Tothia fuscella TaxID=1048955 RepID=A0A9P4P2C7_9PEZI|nr:hypothetical protein EJ08DRAFT_223056 [Tothia fuscella]